MSIKKLITKVSNNLKKKSKKFIVGKKIKEDLISPKTQEVIAKKGTALTMEILNKADNAGVLHNAFRFVEDDYDYQIIPGVNIPK